MYTFRQETSVKYPTFADALQTTTSSRFVEATASRVSVEKKAPEPISALKLAQAFSPIPVRHHYHHGDDSDFQQSGMSQSGNQPGFPGGNPAYNPNPQAIGTPAPTPPPSPKPKKQQYQTDQNRPFLFPFSRSQVKGARGNRLVPFAIDEADRLYNKHMHISVSLLQMWRAREDCMIEESGLQRLSGVQSNFETFDSVLSLNSHGLEAGSTANSGFSNADKKATDDIDDVVEELPDISLLNSKLSEVETAIRQAETGGGGRAEAKKLRELRERREDLLRLKRVEQIYVSSSLRHADLC